MPVVAVINRSKLDDADVAFYAAAADAQLREDFCPAWAGTDYTPVTFFSSTADLPVASGIARLLIIQDTIDQPGAAGYHDFNGVPRSVILANGASTSIAISHEALEMTADPNADKWVKMPDGREVAVEVADPVQGDVYWKLVTILGAERYIAVSNFVLPSWFQPTGSGPFDRVGTVDQAFGIAEGGYLIVLATDGSVSDVWGSEKAKADKRAAKVANDTGRAFRRGLRAET